MSQQQPLLNSEFAYETLPSLPEGDLETGTPDLVSSESYEWDAPANLDDFFARIYRYYEEKGFVVICTSRVLNLLALGFTILFSAFLLLFVKWSAFKSECIQKDTCDISEVVINLHPWKEKFTFWNVSCGLYLAIFSAYWLYNLAHLFIDLKAASDIRHFTTHKLGLSERQLQTVSWPEVASRIVQAQKTTRLCISRDLTEHDIVSRIMRKENYLIGMLNKGVLALHFSMPGIRNKFMLTKTLEWNVHWCILSSMFDDAFRIRADFVNNPQGLSRKFRRMAIVNLLLAPFLLVFLLIYFFLRHAERFYHSPNSVAARRWSPLAAWRLREFNELPYYVQHRLNASHKAAERYISQFPSPLLSSMAKFVAFIAGSFAALVLCLALMDDKLLERHLYGRNLVWWAATLGIVLAASRGLIVEAGTAFEPELAMLEIVAHTHYLPRHWRGRAHTREVQAQFQQLFQYKALLFLEEMGSILLTPFILYFSLPKSAPAIVRFVRDFTLRVEGLGDVCSLAAFDLKQHGNSKYGSPFQAHKTLRSRQGKMEKSLVSFMATYPTWQPDAAAKQLLNSLANQPLQRTPHFPFTAHLEQLAAGAQTTMTQNQFARQEPGLQVGSLFESAELPSWNAASLLAQGMSESEWKVASGQQMVQSFYQEQDKQARQAGPQTPSHNNASLSPGGNARRLWSRDQQSSTSVAVASSPVARRSRPSLAQQQARHPIETSHDSEIEQDSRSLEDRGLSSEDSLPTDPLNADKVNDPLHQAR